MSTYTPLAGGIGGLTQNPYGPLLRAGGVMVDPLLGGSLSIGPTGLPTTLAGQYANIGNVASLRPLTSSLAPMAADTGLAAQLGRAASFNNPLARFAGAHPFLTGAAAVGTGATLGQLGSALIDKTNIGGQNSNWEQGLQGAAIGAGIGGGIGSVVPLVGTGLGAAAGGLIGGAAGVVSNFFGGKEKQADNEDVLADTLKAALQTADLDAETAGQILDTYAVSVQFAENAEDDATRDGLIDQALQMAQQQILAAIQQRQSATAVTANPANLLALQQQAAQIFEPLAQDIESSAALYANAMQGARANLPPEFQAIADTQIARELTSANRLADAYRAQAAITPVVTRLTQYQQDQQALAAQLMQQAQAQAMTTGATAQPGQIDLSQYGP